MRYELSERHKFELAGALRTYYEVARFDGLMQTLDTIAYAGMGLVDQCLDLANDLYVKMRKESSDKFMIDFRAEAQNQVKLYFSNMNDFYGVLVLVLEKLLQHIAEKIDSALLANIIPHVTEILRAELHERSFARSDEQLSQAAKTEVAKIAFNDVTAIEAVKNTIAQYKTLGNYMSTLPPMISTFEDVITYPKSIFKVQAAASSLKTSLALIQEFCKGMHDRVDKVNLVATDYLKSLDQSLSLGIKNVLDKAYEEGVNKARDDIRKQLAASRCNFRSGPVLVEPAKTGGATRLAAFITHAVACGYCDAWEANRPQGTEMVAIRR